MTATPTPFACDVRREGDQVHVTVTGELDTTTAHHLVAHLRQELHDDCDRVSIELAAVDFMDSAGVQALERCRREAEARSARLVVLRPSEPVRLVLQVTGFDRLVEID